ncbi:OPT oligopeptide transporter protein-domain-containing protein [Dactylonectria macrodidyma]|uniref:OPT oligopeptide transporter protein-domain-containing protein n=1 Tax=Dactylonectria macrodidyma TaxID=307937 RepID=A0A9P9J8U3_9HYPO|nr:OPT oligopeptide transporter protein-domain-containing protein [Dactylonectria macrodidyma]
MYFGLQTGWVSIMSMPASLMGFGIFKLLSPHLRFPFSPVENVLLQSVACGMAIMPLGCGFVGVIPALNYLLASDEQGPISLSAWQLIIWSLGLCYFGVVFAVPLRHQVIIRERLKFPSGFSTAVLISVLHGQQSSKEELDAAAKGGFASLVPHDASIRAANDAPAVADEEQPDAREESPNNTDWAENMRLLLICFVGSGLCTLLTYFFPILRNLPVFGSVAAHTWLWTFNPSLAYVGQGIIMGTETTLHMTIGAVVGWGILSPLAKYRGWAPGDVDDWENGSKGWIIWISLAIMLVDAVVSLASVGLRPFLSKDLFGALESLRDQVHEHGITGLWKQRPHGYSLLQNDDVYPRPSVDETRTGESPDEEEEEEEEDAPPEQRIGGRFVTIGLVASIAICVLTIHLVFGNLVPLYATIIAVLMALVLSIMGVRALGETDLNPVSGISKLAQLFFAVIIPQSHKSSVLINLIAGAVSEAGALQAGDLMQDLKTGHLLGAAPKAQFWGQVIGATAGAVLSAFIYRVYTSVYEIPGELFQVPTAYVWIFTARLVTGAGLPHMAKEWAIGTGVLFAATTILRTAAIGKRWRPLVPGGIAVAVGMYNVPSFTLARTAGGLFAWYWVHVLRRANTPLIILASVRIDTRSQAGNF